jgi:hypothetical protein
MKNNESNSKVAIESAPPRRRDQGAVVESHSTDERSHSSLVEESRIKEPVVSHLDLLQTNGTDCIFASP